MAEFAEVMKQAKRMCEKYAYCEECPNNVMYSKMNFGLCWLRVMAVNHPEMVSDTEKIVMKWAAENPEPKYPTWHDAWKQLFPNGQGSPCPAAYGMRYKWEQCGLSCNGCKDRPIPAEIAEKLGVKPISG